MILFQGKLYEDRELPRLRGELEARCLETIAARTIAPEQVISACGALVERVRRGDYDQVLRPFLADFHISPGQFEAALRLLEPGSLRRKLALELGPGPEDTPLPYRSAAQTEKQRDPSKSF